MIGKSRKRKSAREQSLDFMKKTLIFVAGLLITYTIIVLIIFINTGTEPTVLTQYFFDAFKIELVACAAIKIFKLKFPDKKPN